MPMPSEPQTPQTTPGATDDRRDDVCSGRGTASGDHCCYVAGEVCRFLVDNKREEGSRRFECSLRRDLGSWAAVHENPEYREHVQKVWDEVGIESCGAWQPEPGMCCREPR